VNVLSLERSTGRVKPRLRVARYMREAPPPDDFPGARR